LDRTKKTKRLYYPIGIISLIALPLMGLYYLKEHKVFQKQSYLTIFWWSSNLSEYNKELLPNKDHPNREYAEIHLTGNDKEDKIKLDFAQLEIRDLKQTHSLKKGIHVYFDDTAKYWAFVKIFNICAIEKMNSFVPHNNHVWIYFLDTTKALDPNEKKSFRSFCGNTSLSCCVIPITNEKTKAEILAENLAIQNAKWNYIFTTMKKYFISILLFLALVILNIYRLIKMNRLLKISVKNK
jgi:hypothetical protein